MKSKTATGAAVSNAADKPQPGMGKNALRLLDVGVSYGRFIAVERASFTIDIGECVAMVGPNGSGKSSIGMACAGLVHASGSIQVFGAEAPRGDAAWMAKRGVILVPERRQLFPQMTVEDNIVLGCYPWTRSIRQARKSDVYQRLYESFPDLSSRRKQLAGTLSGGQQQMVALARGLASQPRVLIVDEPCLGLAEGIGDRVYELLKQLTAQGETVLLIEEDPRRALEISSRIVRVERGVTRESELSPAGLASRAQDRMAQDSLAQGNAGEYQ
jgi:branched-chain amino acid transport system ATP-binding protein